MLGMPPPIVVPLDGSEKDARALAVAAAVADLAGAALHFVRVVDPAAGPRAREEAERALGAAAGSRPDAARPATWTVVEGERTAHDLVRHVAERDARLVVLATRAAGAPGRALRGSVADHVMRESPRPVVLVPPGAQDMHGRRVRLARLLVPLDGSAMSARVLDHLLELPGGRALEYVLLHVAPPGADRAAATGWLEQAAERLRGAGARAVEVAVLEADDPALAIDDVVREALVDAIAMSTRGAGGLRRLALGSVAERVVRGCDVPVLLLTPACLAGAAPGETTPSSVP
jgi:nucleotide-binding universal stress UspA family protein